MKYFFPSKTMPPLQTNPHQNKWRAQDDISPSVLWMKSSSRSVMTTGDAPKSLPSLLTFSHLWAILKIIYGGHTILMVVQQRNHDIWIHVFADKNGQFLKFYLFFMCCTGSSLLCSGSTLHRGVLASHCSGFSCCWAWAVGVLALVVAVCRVLSYY